MLNQLLLIGKCKLHLPWCKTSHQSESELKSLKIFKHWVGCETNGTLREGGRERKLFRSPVRTVIDTWESGKCTALRLRNSTPRNWLREGLACVQGNLHGMFRAALPVTWRIRNGFDPQTWKSEYPEWQSRGGCHSLTKISHLKKQRSLH